MTPGESNLCWYELGPPELGMACIDAAQLADRAVTVTIEDITVIADPIKRRLPLIKYIAYLFTTGQASQYASSERCWSALKGEVEAELMAGAVLVKLTTACEESGVDVLCQVARNGWDTMQLLTIPDSMPLPEGE